MINQIEIESRSRQNVTHTLYMDERGKAVGCTCEYRQYNSFKACRHMNDWNTQIQAITTTDVVAHIEDELRTSCCVCGRYTKHVICGRCIE